MDKLNSKVKILIVIAILVNSLGMFYPLLLSTFSPYYGSIAKHMVLSNNWTDLVLSGHDWMDKPHLPFWLTAISFKVFGINSFAYIIPGFLFHILGVFYTYRLARLWYSKEVGLLAALFTVTSLHLMLSSIDVRAEAYLLGEIMPACYYWLRFDRQSKVKYLVLGALFTALALMTKGIFVLVTIISGLAALWIYKKQWRHFISFKWIGALVLSFILIAPELISLYQQFDAHPEKLVFGNLHISGIKWFFWDSQFGRFFNTGPIISANPPPFHELYFVHTFLWAYLPWWPMFFASIGALFKRHSSNDKYANVYFLSSFFITFILFSVTKFQVDHYTNILFPFASIICAAYILPIIKEHKIKPVLFYIEVIISILLLLLVIFAGFIVLKGADLFIIEALALIVAITMLSQIRIHWALKTIIYPSIVMCMVFVFAMTVNGIEYAKYDAGYQMARYLNNTKSNVVGYKIDLISLDLHSNNNYQLVDKLEDVDKLTKPFYIVVEPNNINELHSKFPELVIEKSFVGCNFETYLANIIHPELLNQKLNKYVVLQINR